MNSGAEQKKKALTAWKENYLARANVKKKENEFKVVGIDNMNDYYDVKLKEWRLKQLKEHPNFTFHHLDIEGYDSLHQLFLEYSTPELPLTNSTNQTNATNKTSLCSAPFSAIINLAARAGVRYSMKNPFIYYTTNVLGNLNLLELCREFGIKKYILASTSSLYAGQKMPFKEDLPVNEPISQYAASKKSGEVTCYTYHNLYGIDVTILRYFTVYGPAGRPDMAPFRFISWVDKGKPVTIYGDGKQSRDFTFVDDIAIGTIKALKNVGFEIINLGGNEPLELLDFLHLIKKYLNKRADTVYEPSHPADMKATWADITKAKDILDWKPEMSIEQGIESAVKWHIQNRSLAAFIKL